jgi:uncharacterized protein (TIGR02145 family)
MAFIYLKLMVQLSNSTNNKFQKLSNINMDMKKLIFTFFAVLFLAAVAIAQSKTVVAYKGGVKMYEQHVSGVDSVVFVATPDTVSDIDGNVYRTVTFTFPSGSKMTWMVDNLRTTRLNDGTPIEQVVNVNARYQDGTNAGDFRMTPAYCWHMNQPYNKHIYGALYNHLAVQTGKLAPKGWHVATNEEWTAIENYLALTGGNYDGSISTDGNASKVAKAMASQLTWSSASNSGMIGNDPNANNFSGLSLVACGFRDGSSWGQVGANGFYWTGSKGTTEGSATVIGSAYSRNITSGSRGFDPTAAPTATGVTSQIKQNGIQLLFGVRCVKDAAP